MNKVIGIVGSLREQSINRVIFNQYKTLCSDFFELEEGLIGDMPLYNDDIKTEPESVTKLAQQLSQSSGVIFFTPEYNYSIPGPLKNALDWLSRNSDKPFDGKAAAIIGASPGNIGTARMQYHLRQVGVFLNLQFLNKPEVMIGKAFEKIENGKLTDQKTADFLKTHLEAFAQFIQST